MIKVFKSQLFKIYISASLKSSAIVRVLDSENLSFEYFQSQFPNQDLSHSLVISENNNINFSSCLNILLETPDLISSEVFVLDESVLIYRGDVANDSEQLKIDLLSMVQLYEKKLTNYIHHFFDSRITKYSVKKNNDISDKSERLAFELEENLILNWSMIDLNNVLSRYDTGVSILTFVDAIKNQEPDSIYYYLLKDTQFVDYVILCKRPNEIVYTVLIKLFKKYQTEILKIFQANQTYNFNTNTLNELKNPLIIMNENDDVIFLNKTALALNVLPRQLIQSKNEIQKINNIEYLMKMEPISFSGQEYKVIQLKKYISDAYSVQGEDLGIISSSIAHELNNPLAGILAAVNVLEIMELGESVRLTLNDMKDAIGRCQRIVETFLGFSRFKQTSKIYSDVDDILELSIDLLRVRLVEQNFSIQLAHSNSNKSLKIDQSIYTMIFYLILDEVLTNFGHHSLLVENKNVFLNNQLKCELITRNDNIILEFEDPIFLKGIDRSDHLLMQLIHFQKDQLKLNKNQLIISISAIQGN